MALFPRSIAPRRNALKPQAARGWQRGITLIETAVTTSVLAMVTAQAVPAFTEAAQKRHLEGAAQELRTSLQFARMQAVAMNHAVRLTLRTDAGAGCYVVHTGDAQQCDCAATAPQPVCTGTAQVLRAVVLSPQAGVHLEGSNRSLAFDPVKGTITPTATLKMKNDSGLALHQVVNILGRVRTCAAAPGVAGYPLC